MQKTKERVEEVVKLDNNERSMQIVYFGSKRLEEAIEICFSWVI